MYNGIGLATARGSGTNGYVQRNLSYMKPKKQEHSAPPIQSIQRKADPELLLHEQRRTVEIKCLKLEDELTARGLNSDKIEEMVQELRTELLQRLDAQKDSRGLKDHDTHLLAKAKEAANERFASALGIQTEKYVEGAAFDTELQVN
jgi:serine/arginine repetitive matrix protein 2